MAEARAPPPGPSPPQAAPSRRRLTQRQQQQQAAKALRDEFRAASRAKMDRVTAWVAECERARGREHHHAGDTDSNSGRAALLLEDCDGETEDLLMQVLIARPKYEGIPNVEEIQRFAGQLRAYHAQLWTLRMTRGFFRAGAAAAADELLGWGDAAEYPDDIDSLESMSMQEEEDERNWVSHDSRVFVRKISPLEEELRDEMIQEYRNIRRHSVADHGMQSRYGKDRDRARQNRYGNERGTQHR